MNFKANFSYFLLELIAIIAYMYLAWVKVFKLFGLLHRSRHLQHLNVVA